LGIGLEVAVSFALYDAQSTETSIGEGKAVLDDQYLTVNIAFGEPMLYAFTDIVGISDHDYRIDLVFTSGEKLTLSQLGYQYEDFLFQLFRLRNELMLKYLLMEESLIQAGFEAQFTSIDAVGQTNMAGGCEVRLYDSALVILPQKSAPIRLPYCYITQMNKGDYKLALATEFGEKIELSRLGEKFDPLVKALSDAFNKMMLRSQQIIKVLIPEVNPQVVMKLAASMKDGKAARRKDIEQLTPDLLRRLTKQIQQAGLGAEYDFLDSHAIKDQEYIGLKRGLMGSLTGNYTWLLFPMLNAGSNRISNAVALEAFLTPDNSQDEKSDVAEKMQLSSEEVPEQDPEESQTPETAGATYFFRIISRKMYQQTKDEELTAALTAFVKNINRAMIDINFRREPIYLSENQLDSSRYVAYRFAIAKMPALQTLRSLFIGRVIHSSIEQWKSDVAGLLAFNAQSMNDAEKWKKGDI
jgi:hypothetical protein